MLLTWNGSNSNLNERHINKITESRNYQKLNVKTRIGREDSFTTTNIFLITTGNSFTLLVAKITSILGYDHVGYHIIKYKGKNAIIFPECSVVDNKNILSDLLCIQLLCGSKAISRERVLISASGEYLNLCTKQVEGKLFASLSEDISDLILSKIHRFIKEKINPNLGTILKESDKFIVAYPELFSWRNNFLRRVNSYS